MQIWNVAVPRGRDFAKSIVSSIVFLFSPKFPKMNKPLDSIPTLLHHFAAFFMSISFSAFRILSKISWFPDSIPNDNM